MKKKLLSLALALALCLGLMTVPASAAGATMTEIVPPDVFSSFPSAYGGSQIRFSGGAAWIGSGGFIGYGAIDETGKVIVKPGTYKYVVDFSEGLGWGFRDNAWYIVDKTGKELASFEKVPAISDGGPMKPFHDGLARVDAPSPDGSSSAKYGYVDKTGKLVIPYGHNISAGDFHDGLAVVCDSADAYYGYMDKTGKIVIPCQYASAKDFDNGIAAVQLGNRATIIDKTGKDLLPQDYELKEVTSGGAMALKRSNKGPNDYSFFNKSGQKVSGGYSSAGRFADGMARVQKDDKWGYVNESGVLVIPCQYKTSDEPRDGYVTVWTSNKDGSLDYTIFDKAGRVTGTCHWEGFMNNAGNGCFKTKSNASGRERYGFIDYRGKEIVPCKYRAVTDFSGGVAAVQNFEGKWGFVNTTGAEIIPCKFKEVGNLNAPGIFLVYDGSKRSILKSSGWTAPAAPTVPAQPSGVTATPNASKVLVNGKSVAFDAYTISGNNYFKLRDLAYVLSGTGKQFEVSWDGKANAISLTSGKGYTAVGGELSAGAAGAKTAQPNKSKILLDGKEISLTAYTIGGNNYFKLRDIGKVFDFGVGWDGATQTISIDTSKGYTS